MKGGKCMRKLSNEKRFYVYAWFVVETGKVFYIGKGTGKRYKSMSSRTKEFKEVYNNNNCASVILADNLIEKDAFKYEEELIAFHKKEAKNSILANLRNGGEHDYGWIAPQEYRDRMSKKNMGAKNPNYNNHWSDEQKESLSKKRIKSGLAKGVNNPKATPILCLETGDYFEYIGLALEKYNIRDQSNFYPLYLNPSRTAGGFHWIKIKNEEDRIFFSDEKNRNKFLIENCLAKNSKCYIDTETQKLFPTKKALLEDLGVHIKRFKKYIEPSGRYVELKEYYSRTCQ